MGCHCHHLELAISHALEIATVELEELFVFANHTRNNDQTRRLLLRFHVEGSPRGVRLPRPAPTRWSSIYTLLKKFKQCIPIYNDIIQALRTDQYAAIYAVPGVPLLETLMNSRRQRFYDGLHRLLQPVAEALDLLQADSYPTLPMVQLLGHVLRLNCEQMRRELDHDVTSSRILQEVVTEMKNQLDARFGYDKLPLDDGYVPVDYIAAALDPRTKALPFLETDEHPYVWTEITRLAMLTLPNSPDTTASEEPDREASALSRLLGRNKRTTNLEHLMQVEMQRYQSEDEIDISGDSLGWWKCRAGSYPTLAGLARVHLDFSLLMYLDIFHRYICHLQRAQHLSNDHFRVAR